MASQLLVRPISVQEKGFVFANTCQIGAEHFKMNVKYNKIIHKKDRNIKRLPTIY